MIANLFGETEVFISGLSAALGKAEKIKISGRKATVEGDVTDKVKQWLVGMGF